MAEATPPSLGAVARRSRLMIMGIGLLLAIIFYAYTKLQKPIWLARVEIAVPSPTSPLGDVAALIGGGSESPLQYLRGLFESRAARQDLAKVSKAKHNRIASVPDIDRIYSAKAFVDTSQLVLEVRHEDKDYGIAMLNEATHYVRSLDAMIATGVAGKKNEDYSEALAEKQQELDAATKRLQSWTKTAKTVSDPNSPYSAASYRARLEDARFKLGVIEQQIKSLKDQAERTAKLKDIPTDFPGAQQWRDLLVKQQFQLELDLKTYPLGSPTIRKDQYNVETTRKKRDEEVNAYLRSVHADAINGLPALVVQRETLIYTRDAMKILADAAPQEAITQETLTADVRLKASVVAELKKQQEVSTVEAKVNRINWETLGDAYIVDEPVNKGAFVNGILGGLLGIFIGLTFAFAQARNRYAKLTG
jgi:uncharacterized protein involved in exopolysaccharide biosynthesis